MEGGNVDFKFPQSVTVCLGEIEEWASLSGEHDRVCVGETMVLPVL